MPLRPVADASPPVRAWAVAGSQAVLVDLGPTSTVLVTLLQDELPAGPWRTLHEYALVDPDGQARRFQTLTWSLEDDLGVQTHALVDGGLSSLSLVLRTGPTLERVERIARVVEGLTALSPEDPRTTRAAARAASSR